MVHPLWEAELCEDSGGGAGGLVVVIVMAVVAQPVPSTFSSPFSGRDHPGVVDVNVNVDVRC